MKWCATNLIFGAILLSSGLLGVGSEGLSYHGDGPPVMWWVPYTEIAAGATFLLVELYTARKRK